MLDEPEPTPDGHRRWRLREYRDTVLAFLDDYDMSEEEAEYVSPFARSCGSLQEEVRARTRADLRGNLEPMGRGRSPAQQHIRDRNAWKEWLAALLMLLVPAVAVDDEALAPLDPCQ